jgi:hypothetical protein
MNNTPIAFNVLLMLPHAHVLQCGPPSGIPMGWTDQIQIVEGPVYEWGWEKIFCFKFLLITIPFASNYPICLPSDSNFAFQLKILI